jgi:GAF domain-containing protein
MPGSETARTAEVLVLPDGAALEARYPTLRGQVPSNRSLVCIPLDRAAPSVGVLALTFESGWVPGVTELAFLSALADTCGQAVRRVRAADEARQRARELSYLAEVSLELSSSLDYRATLTRVANLTVPMLADWCAVDVLRDGAPTTLAVAHVDPEKVRWAWQLQKRYPTNPNAPTGSPNVIRTGRSELFPEITDEMLVAGARDEEHLRLSRELNLRSALVVPLTGHDRTLGAMTLIRTGSGPSYGQADLALAEDVGRRAGLALDNARLHSQAQDVALQLQRAVLPQALDHIPGWEVAAQYAPGGRGGVGGDFYDAVQLENGRLAFVIGDVMGHGLRAAAAMAQMRAAVRAYLSVDPDPALVVAKLDVMFSRLTITQLATLVYGVVDPGEHKLSFVNAGHYPPLVVSPEQAPEFVTVHPRLPLGAGGDDRAATTVDFGDDDVFVLYTDGLVERRGEVVDAGLERLVEAASALTGHPLSARLADVVHELSDAAGDDDVTAFALRRRPRG